MQTIIKALALGFTLAMLYSGAHAHAVQVDPPTDASKRWFTMKGEPIQPVDIYKQEGQFLQCTVVQVHINSGTGRPTIKK